MGEYTLPSENVPLKPRKKMPFFAKFLIGLLIFILVLPIALVGVFYALFFDPAHKDVKVKDNASIQEIFNEVLVSSFDYPKEDHQLRFRLTEEHFNTLLSNSIKNLGSANGVVRNLYLEITDTQYNFVMEINTYEFFKTRVILNCALNIDDSEDGLITFAIKNIRMGRIDGMQQPIKWLLGVLPLGDIEGALSGSGLDIRIDTNNLALTIPLSDIYDKLGEVFGDGEDSYSKIFMEMIKNNNFHSFKPNYEHAFELDVNLENMVTTGEYIGVEDYVLPDGYFSTYVETAKEYTVNLLNNNKIDRDESGNVFSEHVRAITQHQISGFDYLTESEKNIVQPYKDRGDVTEPTNPYPYDIDEHDELGYIARNQLEQQLPPIQPIPADPLVVTISTAQIDKMLSQAKNLGSVATFFRDASDNPETHDYIIQAVLLNRVTTVINNDCLFLMMSVNINGFDVDVCLKTTKTESTENAQLRTKVNEMTLGDTVVGEDVKNSFLELIENVMEDGAFNGLVSFTKSGEDHFLTISLRQLYADKGIDDTQYDFNVLLGDQTASDPGTLTFSAKRKVSP